MHVKEERSGRWKAENTVSLRLGFLLMAACQSSWLLVTLVGGNVAGPDQSCPG